MSVETSKANMIATGLPGVMTLERTPGILEALLLDCTKEVFDWKPTADRWSISEVLAHLTHVEIEGFRLRVQQFFQGDRPVLGTYDQNALAAAGVYSGKDGRKTLEQFRQVRAASLAFLRTLPSDCLGKKAQHPELGEVTLGQLLNEWAFHDLGHIRQVAEIYRAKVYWPEMGGWQRYYKINP